MPHSRTPAPPGRRPAPPAIAAFHPTGSARMGGDPALAPVDPTGRVRGVRSVYVADASALPSCPGVNPQVSIMAVALAVASAIRSAPDAGG